MSQNSGPFAIDFHVHTSFSYDCPMPPKLIIELARRKGLAGVAVTDHDTVAGALAARDANRYSDFLVIPGVEVKSDQGDVIGLYVEREIDSKRFGEVIREIHDQGGIVCVPHPIRTFGATRMVEMFGAHPEIDLWEMYNGRYEAADFVQARELFERLAIDCRLCGSDAHFPWDVGVFRTVLPEMPSGPKELMALSRRATLAALPRGELALSAGITLGAVTKAFKRGEYGKACRFVSALPWKAVKKSARRMMGEKSPAEEKQA
jgi:predicted metal-dependent phosphoesterase TrpH